MLGCVSGETAKLIRYFQNNHQIETITDSIFIYSEIYQQLGKLDWNLVLKSAINPTHFENYHLNQSFAKPASFANIQFNLWGKNYLSIKLFNKVMEFRFQFEQTELIVQQYK